MVFDPAFFITTLSGDSRPTCLIIISILSKIKMICQADDLKAVTWLLTLKQTKHG